MGANNDHGHLSIIKCLAQVKGLIISLGLNSFHPLQALLANSTNDLPMKRANEACAKLLPPCPIEWQIEKRQINMMYANQVIFELQKNKTPGLFSNSLPKQEQKTEIEDNEAASAANSQCCSL